METSRFAALRQRSLDKMDNARPGAFQRAPRLETSNHQISFRRVYSDRRGKLTIKKKNDRTRPTYEIFSQSRIDRELADHFSSLMSRRFYSPTRKNGNILVRRTGFSTGGWTLFSSGFTVARFSAGRTCLLKAVKMSKFHALLNNLAAGNSKRKRE